MPKIGDVFDGGFKIGEVWTDDSAAGCLALILTPIVILAVLAWTADWFWTHEPEVIFGAGLLPISVAMIAYGISRGRVRKSSEETSGVFLAGLCFGALGILLLTIGGVGTCNRLTSNEEAKRQEAIAATATARVEDAKKLLPGQLIYRRKKKDDSHGISEIVSTRPSGATILLASGTIATFAVSSDAKYVAYVDNSNVNNKLLLLDVQTGQSRVLADNSVFSQSKFYWARPEVGSFSPDGKTLAVSEGLENTSLFLFDTTSGNYQRYKCSLVAQGQRYLWSPTRAELISRAGFYTGSSTVIFDPTTGSCGPGPTPPDPVSATAWSPDGQALFYSVGRQVRRLNLDDNSTTIIISEVGKVWNIDSLSLSPDGQWLAIDDEYGDLSAASSANGEILPLLQYVYAPVWLR